MFPRKIFNAKSAATTRRQLKHSQIFHFTFVALIALAGLFVGLGIESPAYATSAQFVGLGTAGSYSVVAATAVTNTGASVLSQNLGLTDSASSSLTGFPPGLVQGTIYHGNSANQAEADTTKAYLAAANQSGPTSEPADLGGQTLDAGIYSTPSGAFSLTGTLTLDGQGNPNGVFIFQMASTLTTASASQIVLINSANPCNIFWQLGSSATLGTGSKLQGTVLAYTSITATTGASVNGRLLAENGAVTLDDNLITNPTCLLSTTSTSSTTLGSTSTTTSASSSTSTSTSVIPIGAPNTGGGGSSKGLNIIYFGFAMAALGGAFLTSMVLLRRSRLSAVSKEIRH
ncbi:MAG: DUF3494 domain-containing protein [Acidimicrobiales bacterium]|nr:DUF3494 domain-containing protein [Acidimicrobiales bacterium]